MTKYYDEYIRLANIHPQIGDSVNKIKKNKVQMDKYWKYCIKCENEDKKEWKKTLDEALKFPDEWVRFCAAAD